MKQIVKEPLNLKNYQTKEDILWKDMRELERIIETFGEEDTDLLSRRTCAIFYGIDEKTYRILTLEQIDLLVNTIMTILKGPKSELQNQIEMDGIKYGFIPNFEKITAGELIDLDTLLQEGEFTKIASILYRPIISNANKSGEYLIEPYSGYDDKFEMINLQVIEGFVTFFLNASQQLKEGTRLYMEQNQENQQTNPIKE